MSHRKHHSKRSYEKYKLNDNSQYYDEDNNESSNKEESNSSDNNLGRISNEDLESLRLLSYQLRAILIDFYSEALLWNSTMQGIGYILEKYDGIEGNEHTTNYAPDIVALQSAYGFLSAKLVFASVAFTRFNIVSKKKAEGTFKYNLQPNCDINTANIINLISSYYYIRAANGIVARDNVQPVFVL